jgi:hypothetical protein
MGRQRTVALDRIIRLPPQRLSAVRPRPAVHARSGSQRARRACGRESSNTRAVHRHISNITPRPEAQDARGLDARQATTAFQRPGRRARSAPPPVAQRRQRRRARRRLARAARGGRRAAGWFRRAGGSAALALPSLAAGRRRCVAPSEPAEPPVDDLPDVGGTAPAAHGAPIAGWPTALLGGVLAFVLVPRCARACWRSWPASGLLVGIALIAGTSCWRPAREAARITLVLCVTLLARRMALLQDVHTARSAGVDHAPLNRPRLPVLPSRSDLDGRAGVVTPL